MNLKKIKDHVISINKNNNLTDEKIFDISLKLYRIINLEYVKESKNLSELFNEYYKLKNEYAKLSNQNEFYQRGAERRATLLVIVAGLFFVVELALIYYGTYILYTWNIINQ